MGKFNEEFERGKKELEGVIGGKLEAGKKKNVAAAAK